MDEFKKLILGNASVAYYAAAEFFAILALILSLYISSKQRNANSQNTPYKFSWTFLIWDSLKRIVVGQIALFIIFRFTTEIIGRELSMWVATSIGFGLSIGLDQFIAYLKARSTIFDMNRTALVQKVLPPNTEVVSTKTGETVISQKP